MIRSETKKQALKNNPEKETTELVQEALKKLKPKYQVVLRLRFIEDMTYKEIANTLEIPLNTVKIHISRAKKQLKSHIKHG